MNDPMSIEAIAKCLGAQTYRDLADRLLQGIEKSDLEILLTEESGTNRSETARMNCIGGLRATGYVVEGGRAGRGKPYKIVGFAPKADTPPADQWKPERRAILEQIRACPLVREGDSDTVRQLLTHRGTPLHELTWLNIWSYLISRNRGYWYRSLELDAIVVEKFPNLPRIKIAYLRGSLRECLELARTLATVSLVPVQIVGLSEEEFLRCRTFDRKAAPWKQSQSIYDVEAIWTNLRSFVSKREVKKVRAVDTATEMIVNPSADFAARVIDEWRVLNEPKQRQLAVTRDYIAARDTSPTTVKLGFERNGLPVGISIYEVAQQWPEWAFGMVLKSLNYSSQPGGMSGTGMYITWKQCEHYLERGVKWLNEGATDGGTVGLAEYKHTFSRGVHATSYAVVPTQDRLTREMLREEAS
jgi:hypothetical protein